MADLTTLEAVKADLFPQDPEGHLEADDPLGAMISAVSMEFEKATGRRISSEAYERVLDGNGQSRMLLPEYPVTDIASIEVDGQAIDERTTIPGSGWVISNSDIGEIAIVGGCFSEGDLNVVVQFTAGYEPIPADIEQAVRETVVTKWRSDPNAQYQIASDGGSYNQFRPPFVWPPFAYEVVKAYRRPSVG